MQSALGHGDRRDWRGVNREVGRPGVEKVCWLAFGCPNHIGYGVICTSTAERRHRKKATGSGLFFPSLWDLRPGRGSRGPSDSGSHKAKRRPQLVHFAHIQVRSNGQPTPRLLYRHHATDSSTSGVPAVRCAGMSG